MFKKLLKFLEPKWEEVLLTQDIDCYMKKKSELLQKGIRHKSKILSSHTGTAMRTRRPTTYIVLVKKDEI